MEFAHGWALEGCEAVVSRWVHCRSIFQETIVPQLSLPYIIPIIYIFEDLFATLILSSDTSREHIFNVACLIEVLWLLHCRQSHVTRSTVTDNISLGRSSIIIRKICIAISFGPPKRSIEL